MLQRDVGRKRFNSCWIFALWMIATNRCAKLHIRLSDVTYHPLVELDSGRIVHFAARGVRLFFGAYGVVHIFDKVLLRESKYYTINFH